MQATHRLDTVFAALADPTRRAILARLASGEASVTELAEPFAMSQPAISKHLKVLERAGLVSRGRDAQRRPRRLEPKRLREATKWLERYRRLGKGTTGASMRCSTSSRPNRKHREIIDDKRRNVETHDAWGAGARHDPQLRRSPPAGVRRPHQAGAGPALVVGTARLVHAGVRDRPARGRQVPLRVAARSGRDQDGDGWRVPRSRGARADRQHRKVR